MALQSQELYDGGVLRPSFPRLVPEVNGTKVESFDTHADAHELPVGTPLGRVVATGRLAPYDQDGAADDLEIIVGFVYPLPIKLSATEEVQGVVLVRGEVHRDDVNTAAIRAVCGDAGGMDAPTEGELDTDLRVLRDRIGSALVIVGMDPA